MQKRKIKTIVIIIFYILCIFPLFCPSCDAFGYINITSPNDGSTHYKNEGYNIQWTSEDAGSRVKIELCRYQNVIYTIDSDAQNSGSYYWIVPSYVSGSDYYIKITSLSYPEIFDESTVFSIEYQYIKIITPTYSSIYYKGENCVIQWNSALYSSDVNIELYYGGNYITLANTKNDGIYIWEVPKVLVSRSDYRIKIESDYGSYIYHTSPYFTITERDINVISPDSEDVFRTEDTCQIKWTGGVSGGYVKIELYDYENYWYIIWTENDGSYSLEISSNYHSSYNYRLKITSDSDSNNYDYSDVFTIKKEYINVYNIYNGEVLYKGKSKVIQWSQENAGTYVDISLYKDGEYFLTIYSNSRNDGYQNWEIPRNIPVGNNYQIKISSVSVDDLYDFTSEFIIDEQYIIVEKPKDEEIWYKGGEYIIKWSSKNINKNVSIYLFVSGIKNENSNKKKILEYNYVASEIVYKTYNDGSFTWQIPSDISTEYFYKIKICDYKDNSILNYSKNFTILNSIEITSVTNFETWKTGESYNIYWKSYDATGEYVKIELYDDNKYYSTIISNTTNDGNFNWEIPDSIDPASTYRVKISSTSNSNINAFSTNYIRIDRPLLPQNIEIYIVSIITLVLVISFIFFIIKRKRLFFNEKDTSKIEDKIDKKLLSQDIKNFGISYDEYERIWEKTKY